MARPVDGIGGAAGRGKNAVSKPDPERVFPEDAAFPKMSDNWKASLFGLSFMFLGIVFLCIFRGGHVKQAKKKKGDDL
jgi:hypothetical protein